MRLLIGLLTLVSCASIVAAQTPENPQGSELSLVRAIVFKDGFVYTFREGTLAPKNGKVFLRTIPQAREGTLYAYIAEGEGTIARLELIEMHVGERKVRSERMFNDLYELLRQNDGKRAKIVTTKGETLEGILRVVTPVHEDPSIRDPQRPIRVAYVALEGETTALVRTDQIERLTFLEPANLKEVREFIAPIIERRLVVIFNDAEDGKPLKLGIAALEQGIRWDANYRIAVSDERPLKEARVELVATIYNLLTELKGTTLLLAVGIPNFPFRTQLASLIEPRVGERAEMRELLRRPPALGAAITQQLALEKPHEEITPVLPAEVELPSVEAAQLVFYETPPLTLNQGERASLVLFSQTLPCQEVFEWTIAGTELPKSALSNVPAVGTRPLTANFWYALAIRNTLKVPFTTGVATAYQQWRPIGQGLMPFTAVGDEAILRLTPATEVVGDHEEREIAREPVTEKRETEKGKTETVQIGWRVTIEGTVKVRNTRSEPVTVIVRRTVEGEVIKVSDKAEVKVQPPARIADRNPISQIRWQLTIPQGEKTLTYQYRKFVSME
ncbi:MAG: DUF4139 domain-containing protein [Armatimonadetes bacterium]|nr:DUF4139 domain-containing protein [Armatimonadota bacterium]